MNDTTEQPTEPVSAPSVEGLPPLPDPDGYVAMTPAGSVIIPPQDFGRHNAYAIFTSSQMREYALTAIRAYASSMLPVWRPIDEAPKDGTEIIAGYYTRNGNWRTVMALYATEEDIACEWENDDAEPGWYEPSETHEDWQRLEYEPTHFQLCGLPPLPPSPVGEPKP